MKSVKTSVLVATAAIVFSLLMIVAHVAEAVECNPAALTPCAPAIFLSAPPTKECCSKLKEQQPCFCGYINNPVLKPYIGSPNARKVATACDVPFPKCG